MAKRDQTAVFSGPANPSPKQSGQYISHLLNKRYLFCYLVPSLSMKLPGVIRELFELSAVVPVFI